MMCDPDYMESFEAMTLTSDGDQDMASDSTEGTSSDDKPPSALEQARLEWQAQVEKQPPVLANRARYGVTCRPTVRHGPADDHPVEQSSTRF